MNILDLAGNQIVSDNSTLADSGLDWTVQLSHNLIAPCASVEGVTTNKRATVRTDTGEILGVVGPDYKIVQNQELVYMAERIAKSENLKVTSAGELRKGARVWLAVEASSFNVGKGDDPIKPYLLLTNGHDGLYSLSATPTSIRPWCENTLNMAMSEGKAAGHCISLRHKGNMEDKISDLTDTMLNFYSRSEEFNKQANYLSGIQMSSSQVHDYFDNAYNKVIKSVPKYNDIKDDSERRAYNKKQSVVMKFWNRFDHEASSLGSNAWIAFNAMTNWMDHDSGFRGENKVENKFSANFYGSNATKKQKLLEHTLTSI